MKKIFAIVSYNTDLAFFAAYITVGESRTFFGWESRSRVAFGQSSLIRQSLKKLWLEILTLENTFHAEWNSETVLPSFVNTKARSIDHHPGLRTMRASLGSLSPSVANHNFLKRPSEVCGEVRDENDSRISNRRRTNKKKECGEKNLRLCDVDVSRSQRE